MTKTYPAVLFVAAHGRRLALAAGLLAALLSLACLVAGGGPAGAAVGLVFAVVVWGGLRLLGELVEVVAETLLPR